MRGTADGAARRTDRSAEPAGRDRDRDQEQVALDVRAATRRTALLLSPGLPLAQWRHLGRQMFVVTDSSAWWLGDWLIYGRREYPDRYRRALTESGLDYQTLRNYAWVAGKFEPSRRRARLSFQHHAEVAGVPPDEQDEWLARAERDGWSRNELRRQVRARRGDDRTLLQPLVRLEVPSDRRVRWQRAAEAAGLELLDWIVSRLDEAAGEPVRPDALTDVDFGA
ncbi:LmbU family transcriptional regulator [Streptomyces sp. CRN 30]|uniref:LmbU family transcriptional regulator n=1 Tax=Streptomyces sp. CRN 30 TaxID=3075613 RepID=UPI002A83AFBA|nr:LmbU family transcriptional regulator [Streptomyces sp. CRN 30]